MLVHPGHDLQFGHDIYLPQALPHGFGLADFGIQNSELPVDGCITVQGRCRTWWMVKYDGMVGFVAASDLVTGETVPDMPEYEDDLAGYDPIDPLD